MLSSVSFYLFPVSFRGIYELFRFVPFVCWAKFVLFLLFRFHPSEQLLLSVACKGHYYARGGIKNREQSNHGRTCEAVQRI